jgi:KaiC/GvpD/RAD55 family RecA-like ATPase
MSKNEVLLQNAEAVREVLLSVIKEAKNDEISVPFSGEVSSDVMSNVMRPSSKRDENKQLEGLSTSTFLDELFLDDEGKPVHGIPKASNTILTGLPSSGKSLFMAELLVKLAVHSKVVFVTSEDIWTSTSGRMDLETRVMDKAKKLGLDWEKIYTNIYILDTVENKEIRDWVNFISTYRRLVESEQATVLLVDSLTLLEDNRGALKGRLRELMRYNQRKGITSIMVNQRAVEEADNLAMAGGIALSHIVDIVMVMDYKKVSSWDGQLKQDVPTAKQGKMVNFFRILKCRLCRFNGKYFAYELPDDGIVKFINAEEDIPTEEK